MYDPKNMKELMNTGVQGALGRALTAGNASGEERPKSK